MTGAPEFFLLSRQECTEVLARNHVGRLAFRDGSQVSIQPIGYVARDERIYLRSAHGAKLEAIRTDPFVAFEVDEIDGPFDWCSVVVHGTIYLIPTVGSERDEPRAQRAIEAIRSAMPEAFTPKDPAPERQILFGLHIHEMTGRMAQSTAKPTGRERVTPQRQPAVRKPSDTF